MLRSWGSVEACDGVSIEVLQTESGAMRGKAEHERRTEAAGQGQGQIEGVLRLF
jgi:hypothetical protein